MLVALGVASMAAVAIAGSIGTHKFTDYTVPTADAEVTGITVGPFGNIWFTERNADKIGRINAEGTFTEFPLPPPPTPGMTKATCGSPRSKGTRSDGSRPWEW